MSNSGKGNPLGTNWNRDNLYGVGPGYGSNNGEEEALTGLRPSITQTCPPSTGRRSPNLPSSPPTGRSFSRANQDKLSTAHLTISMRAGTKVKPGYKLTKGGVGQLNRECDIPYALMAEVIKLPRRLIVRPAHLKVQII